MLSTNSEITLATNKATCRTSPAISHLIIHIKTSSQHSSNIWSSFQRVSYVHVLDIYYKGHKWLAIRTSCANVCRSQSERKHKAIKTGIELNEKYCYEIVIACTTLIESFLCSLYTICDHGNCPASSLPHVLTLNITSYDIFEIIAIHALSIMSKG